MKFIYIVVTFVCWKRHFFALDVVLDEFCLIAQLQPPNDVAGGESLWSDTVGMTASPSLLGCHSGHMTVEKPCQALASPAGQQTTSAQLRCQIRQMTHASF